ncbi:hypothetical protein KVV02_008688 [Mortierella alpina]|uniref:Uncharacterized protein n=1 Tax=Mortierella alpina TaxID=64518 RepID=A0A9P8CWD7_MORAP|nr:hypothetical protein KVV02_008688 [Mortierella alpina]
MEATLDLGHARTPLPPKKLTGEKKKIVEDKTFGLKNKNKSAEVGRTQLTDQRLLFSCPQKLEVWKGALTKHIKDHTWTADQVERLFFPRPEKLSPLNNLPIILLLGSILATIWRLHFAFIREDQIFDTTRVLGAVDIALNQVLAQMEERRKRVARHQPPLPAADPATDTNFLT